jgi:hypothetical protein
MIFSARATASGFSPSSTSTWASSTNSSWCSVIVSRNMRSPIGSRGRHQVVHLVLVQHARHGAVRVVTHVPVVHPAGGRFLTPCLEPAVQSVDLRAPGGLDVLGECTVAQDDLSVLGLLVEQAARWWSAPPGDPGPGPAAGAAGSGRPQVPDERTVARLRATPRSALCVRTTPA